MGRQSTIAFIGFGVVTTGQALAAAGHAAPALALDAFFFDMNSVAPDTKCAAAALVDGAGARCERGSHGPGPSCAERGVDTGIGSTRGSRRRRVTGLRLRPARRTRQHRRSAIKMIRSITIMGLKALTAECLLSARAAGVDAEVIATLDASYPGGNWRVRGNYNLNWMLVHGLRRAAEMRDAAALGQSAGMAATTVDWQHRLGSLAMSSLPDGLAHKADTIRSATGYRRP